MRLAELGFATLNSVVPPVVGTSGEPAFALALGAAMQTPGPTAMPDAAALQLAGERSGPKLSTATLLTTGARPLLPAAGAQVQGRLDNLQAVIVQPEANAQGEVAATPATAAPVMAAPEAPATEPAAAVSDAATAPNTATPGKDAGLASSLPANAAKPGTAKPTAPSANQSANHAVTVAAAGARATGSTKRAGASDSAETALAAPQPATPSDPEQAQPNPIDGTPPAPQATDQLATQSQTQPQPDMPPMIAAALAQAQIPAATPAQPRSEARATRGGGASDASAVAAAAPMPAQPGATQLAARAETTADATPLAAIGARGSGQSKTGGSAGNGGKEQDPATSFRDAVDTANSARPAVTAPDAAPTRAATATPAAPAAAAAQEPSVSGRPGQIGHELGVQIARSATAGDDTLRVRLNPAELGKIEVTLKFDDQGSLHATMRTESAAALDLLRRDSADLGRALDQAGIRTDAQSFRFESRADQGNGQAWNGRDQRPQNQGQARDDNFAGTETVQPEYRPIRGNGRLDLLA